MAIKSSLSSTPRPTRLTRPKRARASAILSRKALCSLVIVISLSSLDGESISPDKLGVSTAVDVDVELLFEGFETYSAILVRTLWVGLLHKFHRKRKYAWGIGVVMSAGVYLKLTG